MDPDMIGLLLNSLSTLLVAWLANKKRQQIKKADKVTDILPGKRGKK